jgi:hypothetical protein
MSLAGDLRHHPDVAVAYRRQQEAVVERQLAALHEAAKVAGFNPDDPASLAHYFVSEQLAKAPRRACRPAKNTPEDFALRVVAVEIYRQRGESSPVKRAARLLDATPDQINKAQKSLINAIKREFPDLSEDEHWVIEAVLLDGARDVLLAHFSGAGRNSADLQRSAAA